MGAMEANKLDGVIQTITPLIEGKLQDSLGDTTIDVVNPSNGRLLTAIPTGAAEDVAHAVCSSRTAFDDGRWHKLPPSQRKIILHRFADLIEANADKLNLLDAIEMGKPISLAAFTASAAAGLMRFYAEAIDKVSGDVLSSDCGSSVTSTLVPRGVVAAITPWNFPTFNAILKVAPALAAGNCVILKPSELSSQSAFILAKLALEAGLPEGVFNYVPGSGVKVGQSLALHHGVDMLTFTGSTKVGQLMLQYAGQSNMKPVVAECGGKSPIIIFNDGVDLDAAAAHAAGMLLTNQGQVCSIGTRLLVQEGIEEVVVEKIIQHFEKIKPGDATDPAANYGPLVSKPQLAKIVSYIESAQDQGADLIYGGTEILKETGGNFIEPTIFVNVQPHIRIAQEEIFGPVLSVISFKTVEEAVSIANSTQYGLAAYVWTVNLQTSRILSNGLNAGMTMINTNKSIGEGPGHAFTCEPYAFSGLGAEGGLEGFKTFFKRKLTWVNG